MATQEFILLPEATAEQRTEQAQAGLRKLQGILHDGVRASCRVEWSELELPFTESKPSKPVLQAQQDRPAKPEDPGDEPIETDDKYRPGFMALFFPSLRKEAHQHSSMTTTGGKKLLKTSDGIQHGSKNGERNQSGYAKRMIDCKSRGRVLSQSGRIRKSSMSLLRETESALSRKP